MIPGFLTGSDFLYTSKLESSGIGVVLAPVATCDSKKCDSVVSVCGNEAQALLGGLQQLFRWL